MFYGQFVSGSVYLTTDGSGLPIREAAEPTPGAGYHTSLAYEQHDGAIWQVWTLVPDAGTAQDAALMLAQIQASKLSDDGRPDRRPAALGQGRAIRERRDARRVGQRQVLRQG